MEVSLKYINWLGLGKPVFIQEIAEVKAMCSEEFCLTKKYKVFNYVIVIQIALFFRFENHERDFLPVSSLYFQFG